MVQKCHFIDLPQDGWRCDALSEAGLVSWGQLRTCGYGEGLKAGLLGKVKGKGRQSKEQEITGFPRRA